jgi:protein TonB
VKAVAPLRPGGMPARRRGDDGLFDWILLGLLSAGLHLWVYLQFNAPQAPIVQAQPKPIEIQLVAPPAPKTVAPPPPPARPTPPPPEPPPPPPKPRPKPPPKPKPKPVPKPPAPISAPPAPVAAPVEVPVTPAHTRATSRRNPKPEYPSIARRRGWEGKVLLRINVRADGLPGKIEVAESSGREALDESALRTVKRWTFTPAMRGAEAVDSTLTLSIVFKLDN